MVFGIQWLKALGAFLFKNNNNNNDVLSDVSGLRIYFISN